MRLLNDGSVLLMLKLRGYKLVQPDYGNKKLFLQHLFCSLGSHLVRTNLKYQAIPMS